MRRLQTLPVLGLLALLTAGCKKDDPNALPPATREGKQTAGCYIDGQPYVARGAQSLYTRVPGISGGFSFDSLFQVSFNLAHDERRATLTLFLRSVRAPRVFPLNQTTSVYPQGDPLYCLNHATYTSEGTPSETYVTSARHTGQVHVTFVDLSRGIAAGTFEFTAASQRDPARTVRVSGGRFDVKN